jgi:hypothetical protein
MRLTWLRLSAAVFILLSATFLRFHRIEAQSFWNDEGNSARLSERSIPAILEGTASDIHPPLYYVMLRGWRELAGEDEFGLRSLSGYVGVLTVAVVFALAKKGNLAPGREGVRDGGTVAIVVAGLLAAVSPVLVYYSQETRMYALLAFIAASSAWALLNWLHRARHHSGAVRPLAWAVVYTLLLAAGLYTHYFFPAVIAAQGAVVALWWLSKGSAMSHASVDGGRHERVYRLFAWGGMVLIAVTLYLPWVPIFMRQIGGRSGAPTGPAAFAGESARWLALGSTVAPGEATWAVVVFVALNILGMVVGRRRAVTPSILAFVPLIAMFLAGATDPAFFKFMLVIVPFLTVLMGLAWRLRGRWRVAPAVLTLGVLAGSALSLSNMVADPAYARADYRAIVARIAAEGYPNAGIILNGPNQWEVFTYYHKDGAPVYPLPRGRPDPATLIPALEQIAADHDRLYALYWGESQRDPDRVIESWLDANTFKASEEWIGDVRFVVYAVPRDIPLEATSSAGARFEGLDNETITLNEYTVWPTEAQPGDVVQVRLVWSADETPARPYKIFLHVLDAAGVPVAQRDSEPVGGSLPTTTWAPGETIIDNYGVLLPAELPPGEYELRLGLYDAFDPTARLPVEDSDSVKLSTIMISPEE